MRREEHLTPAELNRPDWNSLKKNYDKHDCGEAYFVGRMDQIGLQCEHWGIDMRHDDDGLVFDTKMDLRLWEPIADQPNPETWPADVPEDIIETDAVVESWHAVTTDGTRSYTTAVPTIADANTATVESWGLRGVADIKTKANEDWLGVMNLRHLIHYAEWAVHYDAPVFVYFTMVDMDAESVGEKNILVPIEPFDNLEMYLDHFDRDSTLSADWSTITEDCPYVERSFRAPDGNPVVKIDERHYENFDWLVETVL